MTRRRAGFLLIFGALVPLAVAATAWACGTLATVKVDASVANPGQTLTVTGINYQANNGATAQNNNTDTFTNVQLRWNSRTGPILKEVRPDAAGKIATTLQVPGDATAGWYVINGTQFRLSDGTPKSGTPGRTTLRVQGAAAGGASPWGQGPGGGVAVKVGDPAGPALAPTLAAVLLSLAMLAGGLTLLNRGRARRANRPLAGV